MEERLFPTSTSSFLARPPSLGYFAISSSPSIRSLSLSLSHLDLSSLLSGVRSPRSPRSGVARMCGVGSQGRHTVGSGTRQGHGYQLLVSSPSFSPHVSPFLSPRFCPSLSFLPPGSLLPRFTSLSPFEEASSHLGECVTSSNAPRITINYLSVASSHLLALSSILPAFNAMQVYAIIF